MTGACLLARAPWGAWGGVGFRPVGVDESVVVGLVSRSLPFMPDWTGLQVIACLVASCCMCYTGRAMFALCLVHVCMLLTLCVAGDLAALEEGDWRRLKLLWRDVELGPGASMGLVGPL